MKKISVMIFLCALGLGVFVSGQDGAAPVGDVDTTVNKYSTSSADSVGAAVNSVNSASADTDSARAAAIESLFGVYVPDTGKPADTVRVLPPFHGNYRVLAARPVYALYDDDGHGTEWVSAMAEVYTRYKVASFPRTHLFTMEEVDAVLPGSRGYGKRFSRRHYIDAAKKLGATHVILQEYQPLGNDSAARYAMELYWLQESATVVRPVGVVAYSDFERGLDSLLGKIADAMDPGAGAVAAFKMSIMGGDRGIIEAFGDILAGEGEFSKERAAETYAAAVEIIRGNPGLLCLQYAGALLAGRAGDYSRAIERLNVVAERSGDYPALRLLLAGYLRGAGRFGEAVRAAEAAARVPALKVPADMEAAMIHQARGDIARARAGYDAVIQSGEANGRAFFGAALMAALSGDTAGCADYVRRAAAGGFGLGGGDFLELGTAYGNLPGYERAAVRYLKMSLGPTRSDEKTLLAIAGIYARAGQKELEADVYVNLFKLNMEAHSERLRLAGGMYESLGLIDKAREAYSLFLDRNFFNADVSICLGRILVSRNECEKLWDILSPRAGNPEVAQMFKVCGARQIDTTKIIRGESTPTSVKAMRVSGAMVAMLGLTGGAICDGRVKTEAKKYGDFGDPLFPRGTDAEYYGKVQEMRKSIDSYALGRNLLYVLAGAGLGLFSVSFFF